MSFRRVLALMCLVATTSGCASLLLDRPNPPRYYLLTPVAEAGAGAPRRPDLVLGLGPIRLAGYLDRPSLMTRIDQNRVSPSNTDLWAAPISQSVTSVLVENLATLLAPRQIIVYPWYSTAKVGCQVRVDIRRLERRPDGGISFAAGWSVEEIGRDGSLRRGRTEVDHAVTPDDADAAVGALSQALAQLTDEIAAAVSDVAPAGAGSAGRAGEARGEVPGNPLLAPR